MKLGIKLPAVVDDFSNSTEAAYTAWPDRLYVIDRDGRIAYKSGPGPFGFHPEAVGKTLEKLLAAPAQQARNERASELVDWKRIPRFQDRFRHRSAHAPAKPTNLLPKETAARRSACRNLEGGLGPACPQR